MSTAAPTEVTLGCETQVRVVIIEDAGNLVLQVYADDPDAVDIDALFFDLTDDSVSDDLTIYPSINVENVTGFDVATGQLNQMNNGAQIQDTHDVRIEFGTVADTSQGDVDQAAFTLYVDGSRPLTADDIDTANMTVVVNSDSGNGLALTNAGGSDGGATQTPVMVTSLSEDFDGLYAPDDSDTVETSGGWDMYQNMVSTNGGNDGALTFAQVTTEGPVAFSFDARGYNIDRFENSGANADSLRVEVQIDGGDWIVLDEFQVNDEGTALVGSHTGQFMTEDMGALNYSGGILDTATSDVQFRLVSDISACDEYIDIDNVEIRTTEIVTETGGETTTEIVEEVVASEDFEGISYASQSENVQYNQGWDVQNGALKADGCNDGNIWFEPVASAGNTTVSFDARAPHTEYFENGGCYGDSLEVWALVDGARWELLDTFTVNDEGTALVGDTTGQTITADSQTLSYSGGGLEGAQSIQLVLDADISARNEEIFIDNVEFTETTEIEVPVDGSQHGQNPETCEDFEAASAGDTALNFAGFSVTGQRAGDDAASESDAMIFDTANPTGGDSDLAYADQGNAIILSEDNDAGDPDDNAGGGVLSFDFNEVSDVTSLTILDVEEAGGYVDLYDVDGNLLNTIDIPAGENNGAQLIEVNTDGVAAMDVTLAGSGAVDDVCYTPASATGDGCGEYAVTYDDLMKLAEEEEQQPEEQADDMADMVI